MPPGAPRIPQREFDQIRDWIARGLSAKELKPVAKPKVVLAKAPVTPSVSLSEGILEPVKPWLRESAVTALAVQPKSGLTAVAGLNQILLYEDVSRPAIGALPFPEGKPFVLKFVRGGDVLLAGGGVGAESGKVVAFDVSTRKRLFTIGDEADIVLSSNLSPDGSLLATGGSGRCPRIGGPARLSDLTAIARLLQIMACRTEGLLLPSECRCNRDCPTAGVCDDQWRTSFVADKPLGRTYHGHSQGHATIGAPHVAPSDDRPCAPRVSSGSDSQGQRAEAESAVEE